MKMAATAAGAMKRMKKCQTPNSSQPGSALHAERADEQEQEDDEEDRQEDARDPLDAALHAEVHDGSPP